MKIMTFLRRRRVPALLAATGIAAGFGLWAAASGAEDAKPAAAKPAGRPALTVSLTAPQQEDWPLSISANGNVAAWQEAVIGSEIGGQRIAEVLVNVGDAVKKGQVLARIASENVTADLDQSRATVAEAEAAAAEASANAERARRLKDKGFYSPQQASQVLTAEQTALARLASARARMASDELRLSQTKVLAPDNGTISARAATVGSLAQPGQELFRLVRGNRIEWRAEVTAAEVNRIRPGMRASLTLPGSTEKIEGKVRAVAPTIDAQTRNAFVYVDLPAKSSARAGMYARGQFDAGRGTALTLPQTAVLLRDGFSYVYRVDEQGRVAQVKVAAGRRQGDRIEIVGADEATKQQGGRAKDALLAVANGDTAKLAEMRVVASGVAFLADGDLVRVVSSPAPTPKP